MSDISAALIGGAMIGLAATLVMLTHGQVMGISGIVSRLLPPYDTAGERGITWRLLFVIGLFCAPLLQVWFSGALPALAVTDNAALLIVSGLAVGIGTVTGSGCTSGHGVCGLARLSARSIVATVLFMSTAVITVYVTRHLLVIDA